eukprot:scaffold8187_cov42-Cyclotella_meneghiniana.AAC.3
MIDNSTSPITLNIANMKKLKSKSPFAKLKKALGHNTTATATSSTAAINTAKKNSSNYNNNKSTKWDESGIISPTDSSAPLRVNERTIGSDNGGGMMSRMMPLEEEGRTMEHESDDGGYSYTTQFEV